MRPELDRSTVYVVDVAIRRVANRSPYDLRAPEFPCSPLSEPLLQLATIAKASGADNDFRSACGLGATRGNLLS